MTEGQAYRLATGLVRRYGKYNVEAVDMQAADGTWVVRFISRLDPFNASSSNFVSWLGLEDFNNFFPAYVR